MTDIPDEHRWCLDLYLVRQDNVEADHTLTCIFCHKDRNVEWEFGFRPEGTGKLVSSGVCESCRTKLKPFIPKRDKPEGFVHVDDFIDNYREPAYARFVLNYFRLNAVCMNAFWPFMEEHKLFCTYKDTIGEGKQAGRYRVTGASRMGDIWLSFDYKREVGYELRVNVADCHEWSGQP